MPETAPLPVLRPFTKASLNWVPMDVPKFLDSLLLVTHVEVVIAALPEVPVISNQLSQDRLLECLDCGCESFVQGFTNQEMNVFRHDHVSVDAQPIAMTRSFQRILEAVSSRRTSEQRLAVITTEGEKVGLPSFLVALQPPRHG
jgi:hypothetical protein